MDVTQGPDMPGVLDQDTAHPICYKKMAFVTTRSGTTVLDVGCRTGDYVRRLAGRTRVAGVDLDLSALGQARTGVEVVRGDAAALPFKDGAFETVMAGDVLEHVGDDAAVLGELVRVANKNVLLSVPRRRVPMPFRVLGLTWSSREDSSHRRYYERDDLGRLVRGLPGGGRSLRVEVIPWYPASKKSVGIWFKPFEWMDLAPGYLVEVGKS